MAFTSSKRGIPKNVGWRLDQLVILSTPYHVIQS